MNRTKKIRLFFSKSAACAMAAVMSCAFLTFPAGASYEDEIASLEQKQAELASERRKVEAVLNEYRDNVAEQEEYLRYYDEKMRLQEEEIETVQNQINVLNGEINTLEIQIAAKEKEVEEGIVDFKARLRSMYMSSNDSLASMLVGATDFYDILARMELIERVSRHDNDMIDDLTEKINNLNADKASLEETKAQTEVKKAEAEKILEELRETYNNHEETRALFAKEAEFYQNKTDEMRAEENQAEEELQAYIRKQQEELEKKRKEEEERRRKEEEERRRKEEEERKRKEEEERKRQEELQRQQDESNSSYEDEGTAFGYSSDSYDDYDDDDDYSSSYSTGSGSFIWPCPTVRNMTDGYGSRYIQETGSSDFHKGIDINKPGCAGEPIVASASGTVITASNTGNGYGVHVVIDHGGQIATLYGHMSSAAVSVGDYVTQGQTIGYIGCTGQAYGNHCHFEVRVNGQHTDPLNYVSMNN